MPSACFTDGCPSKSNSIFNAVVCISFWAFPVFFKIFVPSIVVSLLFRTIGSSDSFLMVSQLRDYKLHIFFFFPVSFLMLVVCLVSTSRYSESSETDGIAADTVIICKKHEVNLRLRITLLLCAIPTVSRVLMDRDPYGFTVVLSVIILDLQAVAIADFLGSSPLLLFFARFQDISTLVSSIQFFSLRDHSGLPLQLPLQYHIAIVIRNSVCLHLFSYNVYNVIMFETIPIKRTHRCPTQNYNVRTH